MAKIENVVGISSTYYFRSIGSAYEPKIMNEIESLGHEVGYHYEVLSRTKGDYEKAISLFIEDLVKFREYVDVRTICSHGSPLSQYDNKDIWKCYSFNKYSIVGEAYISIGALPYITDTGGSWNSSSNIRDYLNENNSLKCINTTSELINYLNINNTVYITTHPERWAASSSEALVIGIKDIFINLIKKVMI